MQIQRLLIAAAVAAVFAGCSTQATQDQAASSEAQPAARASAQLTPAQPGQAPRSTTSTARASAMPSKHSIYYEYDKSEIKSDDKKVIEAHADYLRSNPGVKVVVEGNADERGSAEYNLALGQRRADSVSKVMTLLGVSSDRIETVSFGKEKPKVSGHGESAWSENRRSDIVYR